MECWEIDTNPLTIKKMCMRERVPKSKCRAAARLPGKMICVPDSEDAKTLIMRFWADGYTSSGRVKRYVPEWEYVCLNRIVQQCSPKSARPT
jgi:hypothetical protein